MKIRNLIIAFACLLLLTACSDSETSSNNSEDYHSMPIYINGQEVPDVNANFNLDGNILINYSDIFKVFPDETANMPTADKETDVLLSGWAENFGYTMRVNKNAVYLEQSTTFFQNESDLTPNVQSVKVYVNGMMVNTTDVYMEENIVKLQSDGALYNIFPETKNMSNLGNIIETPLQNWAANLEYSYVQKGIRVYLNNNSQKPIEVILDDTLMTFPDQQPVMVSNRTLVPVRTFAESFGWQVEYSNGQTTITNGEHTIILWLDSSSYIIDDVEKVMDVPPLLLNNRTMVPIRFVSEAFGYKVDFNGNENVNMVTVTK